MSEFAERYGSEEQCASALEKMRRPASFRCSRYGGSHSYRSAGTAHHRSLMQCAACRHQPSLLSSTVLHSSGLPRCTWFLGIYLVNQAKAGPSSLAVMRQLGFSYRTAWLLQQKIRSVMPQVANDHRLFGRVQLDNTYLGGERPGIGGRGSSNKVPFVAEVSLTAQGHPLYVKMSRISGLSREALRKWELASQLPGTNMLSDGHAYFSAVVEADCADSYIVVGQRKPRRLHQLRWVNTVLTNLKTLIKGAQKSFRFGKNAALYRGALNYRLNHRFDLAKLVTDVITNALTFGLRPEQVIQREAEIHA